MAEEVDVRRAVLSVRNVGWVIVAVLLILVAVEATPHARGASGSPCS